MIVYQATRLEFLKDTADRHIEDVVADAYLKSTGRYVPHAEVSSWRESLGQMANVLRDAQMPDDMGVGIEYGIPQTSKRIDILLSGMDANNKPNIIVVELKQWSSSRISEKDGLIFARRGGSSEREGPHPSYQAWSYTALLEGFNEAVYETGIDLRPCAYLHNYHADGVIDSPHYAPYTDKAPLFLHGSEERQRLRDFINKHVHTGDNAKLLYQIENGRIRPSKMLADSLVKMLKGNQEFVLIDDQKVVYETALAVAKEARANKKQVVIVKGGPGTGKSVVAINLLVNLSKLGLLSKYVSKNAAPRAVYQERLRGNHRQRIISAMFGGTGAFIDAEANVFDVLVVDEAHRLNAKSGLYGNLGENQAKEIIATSKCTIFFVDDDQMVTLSDIGNSKELASWATSFGANVTNLELSSQFRCNGSDGYLAWLDHTLGIRGTANVGLDSDEFDFRVIESPQKLHELIADRNKTNNRSRVVAGYCWDWISRNNPDAYDIVIPEYAYRKQWNLGSDGSLWIMSPNSIDQVGCIHTCQGLELDYVGVIIGPDLIVRQDEIISAPESRSRMDRSIRGYKNLMRLAPDITTKRLDQIIRNTYRTLMTRGMKGCYIFCVDAETQEYFNKRIRVSLETIGASEPE